MKPKVEMIQKTKRMPNYKCKTHCFSLLADMRRDKRSPKF
jgi:hypothetical protein